MFDRVSRNLSKDVTLFHIGGNAMCWYGLKETTKDVDLVFVDMDGLELFRAALLRSGFIEVEIVSDPEYRWIQPYGIFDEVKGTPLHEEFKPGIRVDLFLNQICGGFRFSDGMKSRCVKGGEGGLLKEYFCSVEDIFLFKSITGRERDLSDMKLLAEKGVNWDILAGEFIDQLEGMSTQAKKVFVDLFGKSLGDLGRVHGVEVPVSVMRRVNKAV